MSDSQSTFSDLGYGQFAIRVAILILLFLAPSVLFDNLEPAGIIGAIYVIASLATLRSMLPQATGTEPQIDNSRFYLYGLTILAGGFGVGVIFIVMMMFISTALLYPHSFNAISITAILIIVITVLVAVRLALREAAAACFKPKGMPLGEAVDHFIAGGLGAGPFLSALTIGAGFTGFLLYDLATRPAVLLHLTGGRSTDMWAAIGQEPRILICVVTTALLLCLHRPFLAVQLPRIFNRFHEDAQYPTESQRDVLSQYGIIMLVCFGLLAYLAIWFQKVIVQMGIAG